MKDPIFHIGYMKTATTWLQKSYFPEIKNITYLGRDHVNDFFLKDDIFDFDPSTYKNYYETEYNNNKRILFSSERIIGPVSLGYRDGTYIKSNAERISMVFPNATIVVFIRSQEKLMASAYMQYVRNGGNYSSNNFLHKNDSSLFKYLEFHKIIGFYKSLFEKVYVFAYEEFAANPLAFLKRINKSLDFSVDIEQIELFNRENPSIKPVLLPFFRFINLFVDGNGSAKYQISSFKKIRIAKNLLYHSINKRSCLTAPSNAQKILGKKNIHTIREYYKKSNNILIDKFGLDFIKEYNYPL